MAKKRNFEALLVEHLVDEYFDGDTQRFAEHTGYSRTQVTRWCAGEIKPQKATVRWLLSTTIAPEFRVAAEFKPVAFATAKEISKVLAAALGAHKNASGVYAFYDSMCNVLYIGKASTNFQKEMYQQLRGRIGMEFPKAVRKAPVQRWQAVSFVSAYEIPPVEHLDYPKHVEALVLRLSKPVGNKVLGSLQKSSPPKDHGTLL
ncbi:hypothetical protein [Xanthomonas bundabergensis]|uniref:hypothetical protein n=1 Tax=Xanthomonas bundabergensis TaxID=3160842 RepID=UPI00351397B7